VRPNQEDNNVSEHIYSKLGSSLHNAHDHPLGVLKARIFFPSGVSQNPLKALPVSSCSAFTLILRLWHYALQNAIYDFFDQRYGDGVFQKHDDMPPVVSVKTNFDEVLVPTDHVSRSMDDTYYVDSNTVLRCHTTAHQAELLRRGEGSFLVTGDVFRRDSIDATHYPVFHQMEGVCVIPQDEMEKRGMSGSEIAEQDLKTSLEALAKHLFGDVETRWVDAYFPFTEPSLELEVYYNDDWLEVLGCGVMQQQILDDNGWKGQSAWAFGLGLERLAMVLFSIPDIRLFWSNDTRFTKQFDSTSFKGPGQATQFEPFSKFPPCPMDVSFWVPEDGTFTENGLCELVRSEGGDLVEEVKNIDDFFHPKHERRSNTFRITYRSMERSLTTEEVNKIQNKVRERVVGELGVALR